MQPERQELGRSFSVATIRAHKLIDDLYESLFDANGNPIEHPGKVVNLISSIRQQLGYEFDMIREASNQYYESKYNGNQQEESLFGFDGEGS